MTNGHDSRADGVRTYRGRTLEEILPKIRAELGPDAIILREREGLVGGVGGFFAQRFIEIDARRGGPSIDLYDDEDDDLELSAPSTAPAPPVAVELPEAPRPSVVQSPGQPPLTDDFVRQLEQAAAAWTEELGPAGSASEAVLDADPEPEPEPEPLPRAALLPAVIEPVADELVAVEPVAVEPVAVEPVQRKGRVRGRKASALTAKLLPAPRAAAAAVARPATPPGTEASSIADELAERGASPAWIAQLLADAAAHRAPLASDNSLRAAVRSVIARGVVQAPSLPVDGAAIAFIGAGGAGKTRCAAALASAYKRSSSLSATAVSIRTADGGRGLGALLKGDGVAVKSPQSATAAAKVIAGARRGGLAVVDTAAVAPGDVAATGILAAELGQLELDAIYVTLPATIGSQPARKLLASFASLGPAAIAITHADETDQLAVAVEIAWSHRVPVAYVHAGTDLHTALAAPDPLELAYRLLP